MEQLAENVDTEPPRLLLGQLRAESRNLIAAPRWTPGSSGRLRVNPSEMASQSSRNELVETDAFTCSGPHKIRMQARWDANDEFP